MTSGLQTRAVGSEAPPASHGSLSHYVLYVILCISSEHAEGVLTMSIRAAENVLAQHWNGQLPVDPEAIAKGLGVRLCPEFEMEASGEFRFGDDGTPEICYRIGEAPVRSRFTIAHEIGHFVLDHGPRFRDGVENFNMATRNWRERAANTFAANLLMPKAAVDAAVEKLGITDIVRLARAFDVSQVAMKYRLQNLGWL